MRCHYCGDDLADGEAAWLVPDTHTITVRGSVARFTDTEAAAVARERALVTLRALCGDDAEFAEAMALVGDIDGHSQTTALQAVTAAKRVGATDPWVAHQLAWRGRSTGWSMSEWALLLHHIADRPNRDELAALPEVTGCAPHVVARGLACIGVMPALTADDLLALGARL